MNETISQKGIESDGGSLPASLSEELNASCRWPVGFLMLKSAGWLVLGGLLALFASIKIHAPSFCSEYAWLTYGRIHPAALNALVYGFCLQASLGCLLWLLVRLGRTPLVEPGLVFLGAGFLNLGIFVGVVGILKGDSTSFPLLEMPGYAAPIVFVGYSIIAVLALITFQRRAKGPLNPPQWFLFVALFWFPWIYSCANLLLVYFPVRGMVQTVIAGWYVSGLTTISLGFVVLATIFYFLPKALSRPLHSVYLAMFTFWLLLLFGGFARIPTGLPVPSWIPSLSSVGAFFSGLAIVAFGWNMYRTVEGVSLASMPPAIRFIVFGAIAFVVHGVARAVNAHPAVARLTEFTMVGPALDQLFFYGAVSMVLFGASYHFLPRLLGQDWNSSRTIAFHFNCSVIGVVVYVVLLAFGGLQQGLHMADPEISFRAVWKGILHFYRVSTVGELLMVAGGALYLFNLSELFCRSCCRGCCPSRIKSSETEAGGVRAEA